MLGYGFPMAYQFTVGLTWDVELQQNRGLLLSALESLEAFQNSLMGKVVEKPVEPGVSCFFLGRWRTSLMVETHISGFPGSFALLHLLIQLIDIRERN